MKTVYRITLRLPGNNWDSKTGYVEGATLMEVLKYIGDKYPEHNVVEVWNSENELL